MDVPSKNMYDTFKDDIWRELGPLDPDWFFALTAQTCANEGNVSDQDELCANQEGNFKTPFDKIAVDSQLFSTPKVFRRSRVVSPETEDEDEQYFTAEQETLPWTPSQSPCLFRMPKERVRGLNFGGIQSQNEESFDLLKTPQKSSVNYAKQISESLGAQIHGDISWTSSLNTPPGVPDTLILTKADESPCPVSVSEDSNVVFVRKLFPHLSNASSVGVVSPKNNGIPTCHQGVGSPEAFQDPESRDAPQSPLNQIEDVWKQKLPDAIEDGEIRSTVASILDGAENVLSIFFTNSSSALRKVKMDKFKRKQIIPTKEHGCISMDISTANNAASNEQKSADQEPGRLPLSPPVKTINTQWSPLSLNEIPPCTVDSTLRNKSYTTQVENDLTKQLQSDSVSDQLDGPTVITDSGVIKKNRKFVYTIEPSKLQLQGKETPSQKMDSSPRTPGSGQEVYEKQLGKASDEAGYCLIGKNEVQKPENIAEENLPLSVQAKVQDVDMSQLCRDFAQDFSQMSEPVKKDTPWNGFSPLACLSAMKQTKQKARQANFNDDCNDINTRRHVSTIHQSNSINKGIASDSGFNSAVADITQMTFVLPSSENNDQSQEGTSLRTDIYRTTPFPCTKKENGKAHLDDHLKVAEIGSMLSNTIKESHTLDPVPKENLHIERNSTQLPSNAQGTVDTMNCIPLNGQVYGYLPEKKTVSIPSIHSSGFKTASNKGIQISSANLQKAKLLLEETEGDKMLSYQPTNCAHETKDAIPMSCESVKNKTSNSNQPPSASNKISCQLTPSQKADVTELCTLLEEADSQFEFTQFKTAKIKLHCQDNAFSLQKVDPDFLKGIDFDDSFSSDAEQHLAVTVMQDKIALVSDAKTNVDAPNVTSKSTGLSLSSATKKENSFTEEMPSSSNHIPECSSSIISATVKHLDKAGHTKTSKLENKNPLILGVGFKTAGGNVLRVSKSCLSKAKALFADIEETVMTDKNSPEKQIGETDSKKLHKLSVENHSGNVLHHKDGKDTKGRIRGCDSNMNKQVCSDRQVTCTTDEEAEISFKNGKIDTITCQSGFQMASGKGISISAKALQDSDVFFKDCADMDVNAGMSVNNKKTIEPLHGNISLKKNRKLKNVVKENYYEEPVSEFGNVKTGAAVCHTQEQSNLEVHDVGSENTAALRNAGSFHGSPSSTAKPPSSLLCTTSNTIGSSAINALSNGGGFSTASGKKVSVSADAMKKALSLLTEMCTLEDTKKQLNQKGDALKTGHLTNQIQATQPKNGGFQTASGKGLAISSAALKKAKSLFIECDGVEEEISVNPTHSKMPIPGQPPRNHGILAAGVKPVAISSEALQKAKVLLNDISFSAEIPAVSGSRNSDKNQDNTKNTEKIHCGFSTAGGAKSHVSQKNMLKAKQLFKELDVGSVSGKDMQEADAFFKNFDNMDAIDKISVKHERSIAPLSGSDGEKKNLSKGQEFKRMSSNPEDPGSERTEFENVNVGPIVKHEKMLHCDDDDNEIHKLDSPNADVLHGNSSLMAQPLSSALCAKSKNICSTAIGAFSNSGGFCTASGQKVSVSVEAMTIAKSLLNESATSEDAIKQLDQKRDTLPRQNGGFQTASGKEVAISSAALKKAKSIFSECDVVENEIGVKQTPSKMPVSGQPPRNHGFLAASGKPVAISSEGLQMAKALLNDISFSAEIPAFSDSRNSDKKQNNVENTVKIHCGFSTAGGAKVHVSQKNLLKAKTLLKEFADGECHDSNSVLDVKKDNLNLTTASAKEINAKGSTPQAVQSLTSLQDTDHKSETLQTTSLRDLNCVKDKAPTALKCKEDTINQSGEDDVHDSPVEEMLSGLDYEIKQTSNMDEPVVNGMGESSVLNFDLLNLRGCTETQQKFLAQEALDCTKALLEDESLAGQSLPLTLEDLPLQEYPKPCNSSVAEQKGTVKRLVEDKDMTGQPPLKRRLLEEFDRTVDGPRGSTLHPEKICPTGAMKDRRVFKYSTSLHPNITRPLCKGKNYMETRFHMTNAAQQSTPDYSSSANSKMPAFVPPFFKSAKPTESRNNTVLKDSIRAPTFAPPFKKQRTVVQENPSEPQEDLFVTTLNSNTFMPPSKKTPSNTDVAGNESKEDVQWVALANATPDQNLQVGCGSKDSAADASHEEETLSGSQDMFQNLHNIDLARDMQDMRIRKKKRQTIRPLPGSLFLTKTSGVSRIPLQDAVNGKPPARYSQKQLYGHGVHQHVCEITSETAESFRFNLHQFIKQEAFIDGSGVQLADGGWLLPSNDGTAGKEEFYRALCDTPGVDPKLIREEWAYNHYRWIVWKQASMERSFPETMGSLCLNPEQVLLQLKYRYDVEVDHSRRPALRKIMEKDDTAAKTLVLCVCGIVSRGLSPNRQSFGDNKKPQGPDTKVETTSAVVWLTDGWYAIKAQMDEPLTAMLHKGRLAVGGKLIIHGAQLVGSQDACSPLEAPESLMLKINTNCSRPTRWDVKLGFYKDPRPFLLPVSCLYSNGGSVGCVDIIILRSYPIQWMERKPDGGVMFRSIRAEEKEARRYNSQKQKAVEILFAKIQAEFEKEEKGNGKLQRRRRTIGHQDVANLQDGEELYEAVGDDPAYLEAHLSKQQLETLRTYRCSLMEKKQAELQERYRTALESAEESEGSCPKREVTPVWRLCLADSMDQPGNVFQLNLWRPSSDLQSLVKEGCRYKVYNLSTSEGKKLGGSTTVQLTGTKKTQFQDLQASQEWLSKRFQPRFSTDFMELQNPEFQPLCGEVDLTGYVISIIDGQGSSPAFYLADEKLNFVKVRCFSPLAQSGLEEVVKPRVLLALSNLQLRGQTTSVVYAGDLTVFSTNPKEVHLRESLSQLRNLVQGQENFFLTAEEKLSPLTRFDGLSSDSSPALQTRTPASTTDRRRGTMTSVTSQPPVRSLGSFTPVSRNPPATNCSTEKDPVTLKRRRALDYLSRVPSPPPLSNLSSVAPPCVNKTFNPPRRSTTPSTLTTVPTPTTKPVNAPVEDQWVNDEELAMIDTQAMLIGDLM